MKVVKVLNSYFNQGDGKRSASEFVAELRALSNEEKNELATLAQVSMGEDPSKVELLSVN